MKGAGYKPGLMRGERRQWPKGRRELWSSRELVFRFQIHVSAFPGFEIYTLFLNKNLRRRFACTT